MKKYNMKRVNYILYTVLLLTATACHPEDNIYPINQDAFNGYYMPQDPIYRIRYDIHEEGVEASIDSLTFTNNWRWTINHMLARVDYDIEGNYNRYDNEPMNIYDVYFYTHGRLDSLQHHIEGGSGTPLRTYHFHYNSGRLSQISFLFGQDNRHYTTDFLYRSNERQPYAIVFTHPLQDWQRQSHFYDTDTIVQRWTLEWENGNLVRATADSMAWYMTGMSHIEYTYDNHPNPFHGYFSADLISRDGFIDNPTYLSRNNLIRKTCYNYDNRNDTTYISHYDIDVRYLSNGYPSQITSVTPTMHWTDITTKATLTYSSWQLDE